jgi:hypothetical protein
LRDLVIYVLHRLRQSRTLHTLTFGPISGVHFILLKVLTKTVTLHRSTFGGLRSSGPMAAGTSDLAANQLVQDCVWRWHGRFNGRGA